MKKIRYFIIIIFIYYLIPAPKLLNSKLITLVDSKQEILCSTDLKHQYSYIPLNSINPYFIQSLLCFEDGSFYSHHGFDIKGMARALFHNLSHDTKQGGSTISSQLARNLYLNNEQTLLRKIKESYYTILIERSYSKEEILENYINILYFGYEKYGIQEASKFYFNKDEKDLSLKQCAMLVAIINGPSLYDPINNIDIVENRTKLVLNKLYKDKIIDKNTYTKALNEDLNIVVNNHQYHQYYIDMVINEFNNLNIHQTPLTIYTTLDTSYNKDIEDYIYHTAISSDIACIMIEPDSYKIRCMIGGKDYTKSSYNKALYAKRQVASTIKPLLYYQALKEGFTPFTTFKSQATTFLLDNGTTYNPKNYGNLYANKDINMIEAIALSDNIYALKTHLAIGENNLNELLKQFDIHAFPYASLALGTCDTSLFKIMNIYTCFASKGKYCEPYTIEYIKYKDKIIYEHTNDYKQLLDPLYCEQITSLLEAPFDIHCQDYSSPTMLEYKRDEAISAKSGTSDYDSIVIGYNAKCVVGCTVGLVDTKPTVSDRKLCKDLWYYMSEPYINYPFNYQLLSPYYIDPITGNIDSTKSKYYLMSYKQSSE